LIRGGLLTLLKLARGSCGSSLLILLKLASFKFASFFNQLSLSLVQLLLKLREGCLFGLVCGELLLEGIQLNIELLLQLNIDIFEFFNFSFGLGNFSFLGLGSFLNLV